MLGGEGKHEGGRGRGVHATSYRDDDSPVPSAYRRQWAWQSLSAALSLTACVRMTARCPGVRRWYVKGDIDIDIDRRGHRRLLHRKPAIEIEIETETGREANTKEDEQRAACATRLETIGHCIAPRNGAAQPCPRPGPRPR